MLVSACFGTKPIIRYIPLPLVTTTCYPTWLPTCPQLVSLSSLHYRASLFWDGEESFSPLSVLVPLVFPNAFFASLLISYCCSLWVLLDPGLLILLVSHLCPCLFPLFSPSCILHSLPIAILLPGCFGKNGFPGLCFSLLAFLCGSLCDLGRNHTKPIIRYSVTFPYPGSLPYVTLLAFLLVPNLSPYHLSTTVLLSRSPAFGTEKRAFILFPFFHYLLL